jgi:hypothetical protein
MSRAAWLAVVAALLATAGRDAHAAHERADADALKINVVGACPDAATMRRLLAELLSDDDEAHAEPVTVQDRGPRYRVAVGEAAAMVDDPARACAARARQAAVFAAGQLHAPKLVLGPPKWTVEKGIVIDAAFPRTGGVWSPGAEIRGAIGRNPWSLVGAAGARGPVTLSLDHGVKAEVLRFPVDAGARLTSYRWRLRPWLVVGGTVTLTGILGEELVQTEREWRIDLGALAMVGATLPMFGRLGGAAALSVRWQPRPYQLRAAPFGTVGETPAWWFCLSLNYTLDGKRSVPP